MKKTTVLLALLLAFFSSCYSKEGFTITGHVTGYKDGTKIKLQPFENQDLVEYTTIQNNTFSFKGHADEAERFLITIDNGRMARADNCILFIGNEDVVITADKQDFPYNAVITGSKHQDILNRLHKQLAVIEPQHRKIEDEYFILKRIGNNQDSIREAYRGENGKLTVFEKKYDSIYKKFMREDYNSYPALEQIFFRRDDFEKKEIAAIYDKLDPAFKNCRYGKGIKSFLDKPQLKEGDMAYDFEAADANGKTYTLYEFLNKGKYILLEFTKPVCGASLQAIPVLKEINAEQKNLHIISLTVRDKENWKKLTEEKKITYTRLFTNENGFYGKTVMGYDIYATPTFLLLSPSGKIIKKIRGIPNDLKEELYPYLK